MTSKTANMSQPRNHKLIVEKARELAAKKKSVLVLVSQVRHGEKLRGQMPEALLVQGSDPAEARQTVFQDLESKKTRIVIATTLADEGLETRLILQIHDELLAEGPTEEAERASEVISREMVAAADLDPPLKVDAGSGPNWLDAK